ncbi:MULTISPECIES: hypothetical protein [Flavobacteriaceae]|nr:MULTISPECIES: hypothetical protein [Flavobacteriaceae]
MNNTIYFILGGLALVYFIILFNNKRNQRNRKSRKFMDDKRRFDN